MSTVTMKQEGAERDHAHSAFLTKHSLADEDDCKTWMSCDSIYCKYHILCSYKEAVWIWAAVAYIVVSDMEGNTQHTSLLQSETD